MYAIKITIVAGSTVDITVDQIKAHHAIFTKTFDFSIAQFGGIISKNPRILDNCPTDVHRNLEFWHDIFGNEEEFTFSLCSYPLSCFHCLTDEYQKE